MYTRKHTHTHTHFLSAPGSSALGSQLPHLPLWSPVALYEGFNVSAQYDMNAGTVYRQQGQPLQLKGNRQDIILKIL